MQTAVREQTTAPQRPPGARPPAPQQLGLPLEAATRSSMEKRFGHDFGDVRVHADAQSAASAGGLDALAYSMGSHIFFGAGQYAPRTRSGERLLAHELAHVVQQDNAAAAPPGRSAADTPALEREAHQAADAATNGRAATVQHHGRPGVPLREAAPATGSAAPATGSAAPAPAPAPTRPTREERFNVGRGGRRIDAELDRSIGWLTARMKVRFNPVNSPQPWPSAARFTQFQNAFIRAVTQRWSFKHFLVPQRACPNEPQRVTVRLQILPVTSGQHFTANVGYTTSFRTSSVNSGTRSATLDALDTAQRSDVPQTPAEHEFGHMLGLPHVRCNRNDEDCYGVTSDERADIMGQGSYVSPHDYEPFAELMPYFTGCNYRVLQASYVPTSRGPEIGGAIGALVGGLGLGAAGAAIGSLFGPVGIAVGAVIGAVGGAIGGYFAGRAIGTPRVPS
jgi:hypothetical protein